MKSVSKIFFNFLILGAMLLASNAGAETCKNILQPPIENVFYVNKLTYLFNKTLPICRINHTPEFLLKVNDKWKKDPCPFGISEGERLVVAHSEYQRRKVKINDNYTMYTDGNAEVLFLKDRIQVINGRVEIYSSSGVKLPMVNVGRVKECEGQFFAEPQILGGRG